MFFNAINRQMQRAMTIASATMATIIAVLNSPVTKKLIKRPVRILPKIKA